MMNRRRFFSTSFGGLAAALLQSNVSGAERPTFLTRGVVLLPEDLSLADWPERARKAGLSTIGIHHQNSPQAVSRWTKKDTGQRFLEQCRKLRLQVEYELHALKELLPRGLFTKHPEFFRMTDRGERTSDANCCVHSKPALEIIAENAVALARTLRPTTSRYFYWADDGQPWCLCSRCGELSASEQAVVVENRICRALRKLDPKASLAHLAYQNTLPPPKKVTPDPGIFLEFAPINRRYNLPYEQQQDPKLADGLPTLDANLQVFSKETAQVLEYWLDVSRFSQWKRPAVRLPWNNDIFRADVETYWKRGIRHIMTFAAWIDGDYQNRFTDLGFIGEYGAGLNQK
jgi:hypothetical protein